MPWWKEKKNVFFRDSKLRRGPTVAKVAIRDHGDWFWMWMRVPSQLDPAWLVIRITLCNWFLVDRPSKYFNQRRHFSSTVGAYSRYESPPWLIILHRYKLSCCFVSPLEAWHGTYYIDWPWIYFIPTSPLFYRGRQCWIWISIVTNHTPSI